MSNLQCYQIAEFTAFFARIQRFRKLVDSKQEMVDRHRFYVNVLVMKIIFKNKSKSLRLYENSFKK